MISPNQFEEMEQVINLRKPKTKKPDPSKSLFWEVPESHSAYNKKKTNLFSVILLLAGILTIILAKEYLFGTFLSLCAIIAFVLNSKNIKIDSVRIDRKGITINDTLYVFPELKSFWIIYNPGGEKSIILESRKWYLPLTYIPLIEADPLAVRNILIQYLLERQNQVSIISSIFKRLGL